MVGREAETDGRAGAFPYSNDAQSMPQLYLFIPRDRSEIEIFLVPWDIPGLSPKVVGPRTGRSLKRGRT